MATLGVDREDNGIRQSYGRGLERTEEHLPENGLGTVSLRLRLLLKQPRP